jgi:hypothetical protein
LQNLLKKIRTKTGIPTIILESDDIDEDVLADQFGTESPWCYFASMWAISDWRVRASNEDGMGSPDELDAMRERAANK